MTITRKPGSRAVSRHTWHSLFHGFAHIFKAYRLAFLSRCPNSIGQSTRPQFGFRNSDFFRISGFGIRISNTFRVSGFRKSRRSFGEGGGFRIYQRLAGFLLNCSLITVITAFFCSLLLASAGEVRVDFSRPTGTIRPLHGGNSGPLNYGNTVDLSAYHRELGIPYTRLHDCHWPNPDVVDIHTIFPDLSADPSCPEHYHFERTDEYIRGIRDVGSRVVFRLGESIEHTPRQYYVHPPRDMERWAEVCLGIIRHYNEGWANGHQWDIRHWEIWNEPDVRPQMWTGSDADYFRLYTIAAKAIKARFPNVLVGGPAVGNPGGLKGGVWESSAFLTNFLTLCRRENAPLDFLSWHCYTDDPWLFRKKAVGVRQALDQFGFSKTESYLNEWNYLPDNDWGPMLKGGQGIPRRIMYDRIGGVEGAAFTACALIDLQDSPLDMANYYTAEIQGFGWFDFHGVPKKTFYAAKAFKALTETPVRVNTAGSIPGHLAVCAGFNAERSQAQVLISHFHQSAADVLCLEHLPWPRVAYSVAVVDARWDLAVVKTGEMSATNARIALPFAAPAVALITLRPPGQPWPAPAPANMGPQMTAQRVDGGQLEIRQAGQPVLRYNYQPIAPPADVVAKASADNQKYARTRSDYIHPLYGLDGEELTKDWSIDHPHHRGIYWAWPEVDYQGERGDLHALQRVFARPTGDIQLHNGDESAAIVAENLWLWEDRTPIVRERATLRAYATNTWGRYVDLTFIFTALQDHVSVARRGTEHYGGLNIRLATVKDQEITFHTDPTEANPRMAWATLSGTFPGGKTPLGVTVLQKMTNPSYPGDWIKYPELNWFQPTFPAAGTRYVLKKDQPLELQFRIVLRRGSQASQSIYGNHWRSYHGLLFQ